MGSEKEQHLQKLFDNRNLKNNIKSFMWGIGLWEDSMDNDIPHSYQKFNNFVLIKDCYFKHPNWKLPGAALWHLISGLMGGVKNIALYGNVQNDVFRTPTVQIVFGEENWVKFLDNGIMYTWRVDKVMFSRGNLIERHRVAKFDCRNQVVVDMFAGIGYFTLPYLVHAKAKLVLAFDWNPEAIYCLIDNLYLNHVDKNCTITFGDVKLTCPSGVADHVNMGLIPSCEEYWETGARALKSTGGILHIHGTVCSKPPVLNRTDSLRSEEAESIDKCIKCVTGLRSLNLLNATSSTIKDRKSPFAMDLSTEGQTTFTILEGHGCMWKKSPFLEWGLHVTHSVASILVNIHGCDWRVVPKYFSRIKKYAPHIFHVVVDLHCEPL